MNNYSNRSTPTSITFSTQGPRFFGEDSKNQSIQNFQTTITSFKHLIVEKSTKYEQDFISCKLSSHNHHAVIDINGVKYDPVQIYAMFLGEIKRQILSTNASIGKVVISVPTLYNSHHRGLVRTAASIVGLNDVEVISEVLASGMTYATKNVEPGSKTKRHIIVDVGYSQFTISLLTIGEKKVIVEKSFTDETIGGRVLDKILCDGLLAKMNLKFHIQSKPYQRILKECEKFKKILSANTNVSINIENVTEDKDLVTSITRDEFEDWIQDVLNKIDQDILKFLSKNDKFDSIELIGGCSRVPSIKEHISKLIGGVEISTTLNQDEAISLGDAYLSTVFMKKLGNTIYELKDFNQFNINFHIGDKIFEIFHRHKKIPQLKCIDLESVSSDFQIEARSKHSHIGLWTIGNFNPKGPQLVRVQFELLLSGEIVITASQGTLNVQSKFSKMFSSKGSVNDFTSVHNLAVYKVPFIKTKSFEEYQTVERNLERIDYNDKINKETKNLLESTIYKTRRKLTDEQQSIIGPKLNQLEDWLYDEGDEAPTEAYRNKLAYIDELIKQ